MYTKENTEHWKKKTAIHNIMLTTRAANRPCQYGYTCINSHIFLSSLHSAVVKSNILRNKYRRFTGTTINVCYVQASQSRAQNNLATFYDKARSLILEQAPVSVVLHEYVQYSHTATLRTLQTTLSTLMQYRRKGQHQ